MRGGSPNPWRCDGALQVDAWDGLVLSGITPASAMLRVPPYILPQLRDGVHRCAWITYSPRELSHFRLLPGIVLYALQLLRGTVGV